MPVRQKKAKGLPKRTGKRKAKRERYYATGYLRNKLRHILARNGEAAARRWAASHMADGVLNALIAGRG